MALTDKAGRNLEQERAEQVRVGLEQWLTAKFAASNGVRLGPIGTPAEGFSSETLILDATWREAGEERHDALVGRLPPRGGGVFPTYDLEGQARAQAILHAHGIAAALPLDYEADPRWIGTPFYLMRRIAGQPMGDMPPYHKTGWVKELAPATQRAAVLEFIDGMAAMHRLDWQAAGLEFVARQPRGVSRLADEFAWWENYLRWASAGDNAGNSAADAQSVAAAMAWCKEHWPATEPAPSFIWGDARPGNVLYDADNHAAAFLDFEMMSIAPAEVDLGWWMAIRLSHYVNDAGTLPELPGFPDHDESIALYEDRLGRKAMDVAWYEVFGAARAGACMCRMMRLLAALGGVPESMSHHKPITDADWVQRIVKGGSRNV